MGWHWKNFAIRLTLEEGVIQWMQVLFLVMTAFYCFRIVRSYGTIYQERIIRDIFFLCLIVTLAVAGEEISWGQRLLGLETPELLKRINIQQEITVHNLVIFQRFRHWLLLLFGLTGLALICPGIRRYRWTVRFAFLSPPVFFTAAISLVLISGLGVEVAYLSQWLHPGQVTDDFRFWAGRFSEIGELGVAITAFSYAADKVNSLRLRIPQGLE